MADDRTIFDEPHHQSLELLAAQALSDGNIATAFKLADRRCRILPAPEPHCYVLRGEASFRLGAKADAIADIAKALEIAPDNIAANRRKLAWAKRPQQRIQAAFTLVGRENDFESVRKPIQVLRENGERNFVHLSVFADAIVGWAVWEDEAALTISITDDTDEVSTIFEPSAFHPLAEYGCATDFVVKRPKSTVPQSIQLSVAGNVFYSTRAAGNEAGSTARVHWPRPKNARDQSVTVIVPIYDDYDAVRRCLETLLDELSESHHRAILVGDATPDPQIAKYLAELATEPHVDVLINPRNLGYIGSINRALAQFKQDDVIVLSSDTIVTRGFINRLAAAARSSPDIGTVTPLSNNGNLVSFPTPFKPNPICSREETKRIDAIAAQANSDRIVDIPCGIGFCLYLTRACLDIVGPLSEDLDTGYLADVDFCLRARDRGFRSVCAPSVYIGQASSKSFGQQKRSPVVRNLSVLEQRFPQHSLECEAFIVADPLKTARQAIERVAAATDCRARLLVTGAGTISAVARQRARELSSDPTPVMILEVRYQVDGVWVKIFNAAGGMPQSLQFNLSISSEYNSLVDLIQSMRPSRIEFLDPANVPFLLVDFLLELKIPYDIFVADAGLLGNCDAQPLAAAVRSLANQGIDEHEALRKIGATQPKTRLDRWREIAGAAQQLLAPSPQAKAFAVSVLPERKIEMIGRPAERRRRVKRKTGNTPASHIGFVPVRCCAHEQLLMREIARGLNGIRPAISITIIGATLDDISLMRSGNLFVTGPVDPAEIKREIDSLDLRYLFVCTTQPLFEHPILSAVHCSSLPMAYFDWSKGQVRPKKNDLPIDPGSSLDDIIGALDRWMPTP